MSHIESFDKSAIPCFVCEANAEERCFCEEHKYSQNTENNESYLPVEFVDKDSLSRDKKIKSSSKFLPVENSHNDKSSSKRKNSNESIDGRSKASGTNKQSGQKFQPIAC